MRWLALNVSLAVALAGCTGSGDGRRATGDTDGLAPVQSAGGTARPPTTSALTGAWRLERAGARAGSGPGITLSLVVDSVRAGAVYGRLTRYMAGNAGTDPTAWGPLTGTVASDTVRLRAPGRRDGAGEIALAGLLAADTVVLSRFVLGPDDLAAGAPGRWRLVRER